MGGETGLISTRAIGSVSAVLIEVDFFVVVSQVFFLYLIIYCLNGCFGETAFSGCFIILNILLIFYLTWKKNYIYIYIYHMEGNYIYIYMHVYMYIYIYIYINESKDVTIYKRVVI